MKNSIKRVLSMVLCVVMVMAMAVTPAFAATHETGDGADMNPKTTVYEIGKKSFYKVNDDGSIVYADREESAEYEAVPSAYISGSKYNEGNVAYGMYVTKDGDVKVVKLDDCQLIGGVYKYDHATEDSATVSTEVDTADNADNQMSTQFYINIENGITDEWEDLTEETVPGTDAHNRISYEVVVATSTTYQLNVTVPMYVCMYGYRGTGNVVTPTQDAYQMKNYSTINENTNSYVKSIVKLTQYAQIIDEDHSDEELYAIAYSKDTNTYTWWYSEPTISLGTYTDVFNLKDNGYSVNASGETYVLYMDGNWYIAAAGTLDNGVLREDVAAIDPKCILAADLVVDKWNFGKEFAVGDNGTWEGGERTEGLAVKVDELQAEPATWRLVDAETAPANIKRGELIMTIAPQDAKHDASAIDLSECSAATDISERGWLLAAPEMDAGKVKTPSILGLSTYAQMAGGDVNEAGCVPVVKVTYTVIPMFGELGVAEKLVESN